MKGTPLNPSPEPVAMHAPKQQQEPKLYLFKLPLVIITIISLVAVLLSPWPQYQNGLWLLVFFNSCSLLSVACQAARMVATVRRYHRLYVTGSCSKGSSYSSNSSKASSLQSHCNSSSSLDSSAQPTIDAAATANSSGTSLSLKAPRWRHVFVIANYMEDMSTLTAALDQLASHAWASNYTILLAMEGHEAGATHKARRLQQQYSCTFGSVLFTVHELTPAEMCGKGSNLNSAVRQFYKMVPTRDISSFMLTILDADAWVPFEYVQQLESVSSTVQDPGSHMYAAPAMFERDNSKVPGIVRATDTMWSALAFQNLNGWTGVAFPISNYSLSLQLAHEVGYWDVQPDAVGEDFHMFIKACLCTNGSARMYPLHAPISMRHVQGRSQTWLSSVWARFLQAERHLRGIADTAYVLHEWRRSRLSLKKLILLLACLEAHLIPVVTPSSLIVLPVYYNLFKLATTHSLPSAQEVPVQMRVLTALSQVSLAFVVVILICYERLRAIVRTRIYGMSFEWRNMRYVLRWLNYFTLIPSGWMYAGAPVVVVVAKHLFNVTSRDYYLGRLPRHEPSSGQNGNDATDIGKNSKGQLQEHSQEGMAGHDKLSRRKPGASVALSATC